MPCFASPHTIIKDQKCLCQDGYMSKKFGIRETEIKDINDICVSSYLSEDIIGK